MPWAHETLYVQRMPRYLTGTPDILAHPPSIASMEVQSLRRDSPSITDAALRNISWYSRSMLSGRLIAYQDYKALRRKCSGGSANLRYPKHFLETLIRVQLSRRTTVPPVMLNNPLPPNRAVPEPMWIRFFPEFVEALPILERDDAFKGFEKALYWKIVAMMAGALSAKRYWTEREMLRPESTLSLSRRTMLQGVPGVGWIDGYKWVASPCAKLFPAPMTSGAFRCPAYIGALITRSGTGLSGPIMTKGRS